MGRHGERRENAHRFRQRPTPSRETVISQTRSNPAPLLTSPSKIYELNAPQACLHNILHCQRSPTRNAAETVGSKKVEVASDFCRIQNSRPENDKRAAGPALPLICHLEDFFLKTKSVSCEVRNYNPHFVQYYRLFLNNTRKYVTIYTTKRRRDIYASRPRTHLF